MGYHHLALAVKDMKATHHFYEEVMGFELVKVEVAPLQEGGWGKHCFYRMDGNDATFIAFWELHDAPGQDSHIHDINKAANMPIATNHYSFDVVDSDELQARREAWNAAGLDVFEIDHNWCRSIYTRDPNGNLVGILPDDGRIHRRGPAARARGARRDRDETEQATGDDEELAGGTGGGVAYSRAAALSSRVSLNSLSSFQLGQRSLVTRSRAMS